VAQLQAARSLQPQQQAATTSPRHRHRLRQQQQAIRRSISKKTVFEAKRMSNSNAEFFTIDFFANSLAQTPFWKFLHSVYFSLPASSPIKASKI
jgi:hypothetical protein